MKAKKLISLALALIMTLALSAPALAAGYTDLEGHWAKEYMEDLAERGFLKGDGNNTMRPNSDITGAEILTLLSRFYELSSKAAENIYDTFGSFVEKNVPENLSWAYKPITICMAADICSEEEIKGLNLTRPIEKELLSVFMVRAMKMEEKALAMEDTEMDFGDYDEITEEYLGYVKVLVDAKIVEGDENGNFTPKRNVSRAIVATMVSRVLTFVEKEEIDLTIKGYDGSEPDPHEEHNKINGVMTAISGSELSVRGFDGLPRKYALDEAKIVINGGSGTLTSTHIGAYVTACIDKEAKLDEVSVTTKTDETCIQGEISSTSSSGGFSFTVKNLDTGTSTSFTLKSSQDIDLTLDGKSTTTLTSLKPGHFVNVTKSGDTVIRIEAFSEVQLKATLKSMSYATTMTMVVTDGTAEYTFHMNINNLPKITRGGKTITIDRLNPGDTLNLTIKGSTVTNMDSQSTQATVSGTISSMVTTTEGISWVIRADDGSMATLTISPTASVWYNNREISLSDVKAGDKITASVYQDVAVEIVVESQVSTADSVSGLVLNVDASDKMITIAVSNSKLCYVDVSSAGSIVSSSTGKTVKLDNIDADTRIRAYGGYTSANEFKAATVIVEG